MLARSPTKCYFGRYFGPAWLEMAGRIDDDLLEQIAVVGYRGEVADKIRARCAGFADRVSLVAPFAPDANQWADIVEALNTEG